jgi:hypothetical protein
MNGGMLAAGLASMRWCSRRDESRSCRTSADVVLAAVLGMTFGMLTGSALAARAGTWLALGESAMRLCDWLAMTAGMAGGMVAAERGVDAVRRALQDGKRSSRATAASKATARRFSPERFSSTITE